MEDLDCIYKSECDSSTDYYCGDPKVYNGIESHCKLLWIKRRRDMRYEEGAEIRY